MRLSKHYGRVANRRPRVNGRSRRAGALGDWAAVVTAGSRATTSDNGVSAGGSVGAEGLGVSGYRVLGQVEVWADERRLSLGGPRQVALLAFLLLSANRAVSADALIDAVWGPERDGAAKRLQMAIARLRKALAPLESENGSVLWTVSGGYLLSVRSGELDAELFRGPGARRTPRTRERRPGGRECALERRARALGNADRKRVDVGAGRQGHGMLRNTDCQFRLTT